MLLLIEIAGMGSTFRQKATEFKKIFEKFAVSVILVQTDLILDQKMNRVEPRFVFQNVSAACCLRLL